MTTEELYESMSTEELLRLRYAFLADRTAAHCASTIEFCDNRLSLIMTVLDKRGEAVWPVCAVCGMDSNFSLNGQVQTLCYEHHPNGKENDD